MFVLSEIVAVPLMVSWGRSSWFNVDDWDFLAARKVGDLGDLMRPHFGHWTTLPVIAYRATWELVGLRSYTPYLLLAVVTHLAVAALLRAVMRRAGVGPWLSTLGAVVFIFFGSGAENVLVAFQITFVGALAFGLSQLLLADHDGPLGMRDWFALLCGFAALLCSGIGVTMVLIVGLAVLMRRGWRIAIFHTAPLGTIFLTWLFVAPEGQSTAIWKAASPGAVLRFACIGLETAFARLGQLPGVGILLGLVLVGGLALAYAPRGRHLFRGPAAAPFALLVGAILFLVITGWLRSGEAGLLAHLKGNGPARARLSRYVYVVGALSVPAIAFAAQMIIRRWPRLTVPLIALLVIGIPGNVRHFANYRQPPYIAPTRRNILAAAQDPFAKQLPLSLMPEPFYAREVTVGWLLDGRTSGRIPAVTTLTPNEIASETLSLALRPSPRHGTSCRALRKPTVLVLRKGDSITVKLGIVSIINVPVDAVRSFPRRVSHPSSVVALAGPLRLRLAPQPDGGTQRRVVVCL